MCQAIFFTLQESSDENNEEESGNSERDEEDKERGDEEDDNLEKILREATKVDKDEKFNLGNESEDSNEEVKFVFKPYTQNKRHHGK